MRVVKAGCGRVGSDLALRLAADGHDGAANRLAYGIPLEQALFESVSAGASVGLSVGVTSDPHWAELIGGIALLLAAAGLWKTRLRSNLLSC